MQPIDRPTIKPRRSHRRFWIVLAIIGAILALSCIACTVFASLLPRSAGLASRTQTTGTRHTPAPETPLATPASSARPGRTSTSEPEPTATPSPSITHGKPAVGGPYSDFLGKYGQPFQPGSEGSEDFWADQAQTTLLNVTTHNGKVVTLDIESPDAWSERQTQSYCEQFLPNGAHAFNAIDGTTDFRSGSSTIVMVIYEQGACSLSISP